MAFGFDKPLSEYFVNVYDIDDELILDLNSNGMSMVTGKGKPIRNTDMYQTITNMMTEQDRCRYEKMLKNILLDLPF